MNKRQKRHLSNIQHDFQDMQDAVYRYSFLANNEYAHSMSEEFFLFIELWDPNWSKQGGSIKHELLYTFYLLIEC